MANGEAGGTNPPYGPWSSFATFVKGLHGAAVPPVIDHTLIRHLSGSAQSQLRGALRFLSLVEGDDDAVTPELRALVAASADEEEWKAKLASLIPRQYEPIVRGVDLDAGTRGQLESAFRDNAGVTGSVLQKAVRFYLSGITDAGITVSPHFGAPGANGKPAQPRKASPRRNKRARGAGTTETPEAPAPAGETETITVSIPNGRTVRVVLPTGLKAGEEDFLLMYLKGYFGLKRPEND